MRVSVSYGFGKDNRYNQSSIPRDIQLAIFKSDLFWRDKDYIVKQLKEHETHVNVVHLPLDTLRQDPSNIFRLMDLCKNEFGCRKFVIHPNKLIKEFVGFFQTTRRDVELCIENFQWRKKKVFRSPLEIIDHLNWINEPHESPCARMTLDTSHAEEVWFDHRVMSYLLKYVSVIHLSNRIGKKSHMPFNVPGGDLNLVGFVLDLKNRYHWDGDIVLEYMEEHRHKLYKNHQYVKRLLGVI